MLKQSLRILNCPFCDIKVQKLYSVNLQDRIKSIFVYLLTLLLTLLLLLLFTMEYYENIVESKILIINDTMNNYFKINGREIIK